MKVSQDFCYNYQ